MAKFARRTHCRRGHPMVEGNIRLQKVGGRTARLCRTCVMERNKPNVKRWVVRQRAKGLIYAGYTQGNIARSIKPDQVEAVIEAVRVGGVFKAAWPILGRAKTSAFLHFNPAIRADIKRMLSNARTDAALLVGSPAILRHANAGERVFDFINGLMPRHLAKDHRDDVASDMWTAWREGRLRVEDMPRRSREFINRRYGTDHNSWGAISLDTPMFQDGSATLADVIPDSGRLWA